MTDVKRLFDFPYYQLEKFPKEDAFVTKVAGEWVKTSTRVPPLPQRKKEKIFWIILLT